MFVDIAFDEQESVSQQLVFWFANLSSSIEVAVVKVVAVCFADMRPHKAQLINDLNAHESLLILLGQLWRSKKCQILIRASIWL